MDVLMFNWRLTVDYNELNYVFTYAMEVIWQLLKSVCIIHIYLIVPWAVAWQDKYCLSIGLRSVNTYCQLKRLQGLPPADNAAATMAVQISLQGILTIIMLNCFNDYKNMLTFWIIAKIWLDSSRWNQLWNNNTCCLSYTANNTPAYSLATLGAMPSSAMVLTTKGGIFCLQH